MQMDIAFSPGNLKGHVQQITQDPYGYVLISNIQVSFGKQPIRNITYANIYLILVENLGKYSTTHTTLVL